MNTSLTLILVAALCGVGGQLALKLGVSQIGRIGTDGLAEPLALATRLLTSPLVLGGLGLYVLGAGVWLTVLSRTPLSVAYPILAIGYAVTPLLAWVVLGESIPSTRWLGIGTICLGVLVVVRS